MYPIFMTEFYESKDYILYTKLSKLLPLDSASAAHCGRYINSNSICVLDDFVLLQ